MLLFTSDWDNIRHISISLVLLPNPFIEEPTTYNPQSAKKKMFRDACNYFICPILLPYLLTRMSFTYRERLLSLLHTGLLVIASCAGKLQEFDASSRNISKLPVWSETDYVNRLFLCTLSIIMIPSTPRTSTMIKFVVGSTRLLTLSSSFFRFGPGQWNGRLPELWSNLSSLSDLVLFRPGLWLASNCLLWD